MENHTPRFLKADSKPKFLKPESRKTMDEADKEVFAMVKSNQGKPHPAYSPKYERPDRLKTMDEADRDCINMVHNNPTRNSAQATVYRFSTTGHAYCTLGVALVPLGGERCGV